MENLFEDDTTLFNGDYGVRELESFKFNYTGLNNSANSQSKYAVSESGTSGYHSVSSVTSADKIQIGKHREKKAKDGVKRKIKKNTKYIRNKNSLGVYSKKLVNLLKSTSNGTLSVNSAVNELSIPRRRFYDVTHVLEGIGLLEKPSQNKIIWKGSLTCDEQMVEQLKNENSILEGYEEFLNTLIKDFSATLVATKKENEDYAYVLSDDIKSIHEFKNGITIATRANPDTSLYKSDDFKLELKSKNPICMHVVNENELINIGYEELVEQTKEKLCEIPCRTEESAVPLPNVLFSDDTSFCLCDEMRQTKSQLIDGSLDSDAVMDTDYIDNDLLRERDMSCGCEFLKM